MKKLLNSYNTALLLIAGAILLLVSCEKKETDHASHSIPSATEQVKVYTCPMHPEIIRNKPGTCPICGMDLVEKGAVSNSDGLASGVVVEPLNPTILQGTKTITPKKESLSSTVTLKGYITYNPKNISSVSSRFAGRIDKLYVRYNFQEVVKGQKLMDVYSPELMTAQQNFIFILTDKDADPSLLYAAKEKLILLGMNENQIQQLERTRKAEYLVSIYAPVSGHIHQMNNADELTMPIMSMNETNDGMNNASSELVIREGNYLQKGEIVFSIISLSDTWAILKIYPDDISKIEVGQAVEIISEIAPENAIMAKVNYIEPVLERDSKFISARIYLEKSDHHIFKIGSLVDGVVHTGKQNGLWVPVSSTLNLGNGHSIVFKKEGNAFKTYPIKTGTRENNVINVLNGLSETDTIAVNAWYMIDSESFVLEK